MNGTASASTRQVSAAGSTSTPTSATSATAVAASVSRSRARSRFQRACSPAAPSASASASSGMRATVPSSDAPDRGRPGTAARALRRAAAAALGGRGERRGVHARRRRPGTPPRRHLLRLRPERPARADPEAVLPRGRLASAGRRRPRGRALRSRRAARGDGRARHPDRARALPRQLRGDLALWRRRDRLAHPRLLGDHRRREPRADRHARDQRRPLGNLRRARPARSAHACSRPAARSGATGSSCTTPR